MNPMKAKKPKKSTAGLGGLPTGETPLPIDSTAEFERLLKETAEGQRYVLRLFVTGTTTRSAKAIENIHTLCENYLHGRYELEVIDIYQQPSAAAAEQIIAAPTLVQELPEPARRLIGDLGDPGRVLIGLNLASADQLPDKWLKV
jgi:circadian clock protein KaiB